MFIAQGSPARDDRARGQGPVVQVVGVEVRFVTGDHGGRTELDEGCEQSHMIGFGHLVTVDVLFDSGRGEIGRVAVDQQLGNGPFGGEFDEPNPVPVDNPAPSPQLAMGSREDRSPSIHDAGVGVDQP